MNLALIIAVISVALNFLLILYFRWYLRRRNVAKELLAEYRNEVDRLLADVDFVTDRDSQLVEERIKTLNQLLSDTDKRIAVYMKELERSRSGEALYSRLGNSPEGAKLPLYQVSNLMLSPPESGESAVGQRTAPPRKTGKKAPPEPEKKDIRLQIAELAIQGHDPARIASKLKISVLEAELALNLLRKQS